MWRAGAYHGRSCPTALALMPLLAAALDDSAFAIVLLAIFVFGLSISILRCVGTRLEKAEDLRHLGPYLGNHPTRAL